MENYIVINGRKAELTEEQLKALGIETEKKSPFDRVHNKKTMGTITLLVYLEKSLQVSIMDIFPK